MWPIGLDLTMAPCARSREGSDRRGVTRCSGSAARPGFRRRRGHSGAARSEEGRYARERETDQAPAAGGWAVDLRSLALMSSFFWLAGLPGRRPRSGKGEAGRGAGIRTVAQGGADRVQLWKRRRPASDRSPRFVAAAPPASQIPVSISCNPTVSVGFVVALAAVAKAADSEFDDFMEATLIKVCAVLSGVRGRGHAMLTSRC